MLILSSSALVFGQIAHRLREFNWGIRHRFGARCQRIVGIRELQLDHRADIAGKQLTDRNLMLALHDVDLIQFFNLVFLNIQDLSVCTHDAGHNL